MRHREAEVVKTAMVIRQIPGILAFLLRYCLDGVHTCKHYNTTIVFYVHIKIVKMCFVLNMHVSQVGYSHSTIVGHGREVKW